MQVGGVGMLNANNDEAQVRDRGKESIGKDKTEHVAVIVPHQDDELIIAGQVLPYFIEDGVKVSICFTTNGDYVKANGPIRYQESMMVSRKMGLDDNDVFYFGYPDGGDENRLYAHSDQFVSQKDKTLTYGPKSTFALQTVGHQRACNRASFLADLLLFLRQGLPDLIICIGMDNHPDHKALSLMLEEAVSTLIKDLPEYRPLILKKFAYAGCWHGPDDYKTFKATQKPSRCNEIFQLDAPYVCWEERLRLKPHPKTVTRSIGDNWLYQLACLYRSQRAAERILRACNGDVVFWTRRTDNKLLEASVTVSHGEAKQLLNFERYGLLDVNESVSPSNIVEHGINFIDTLVVQVAFDEPIDLEEVAVVGAAGIRSNLDLSIYVESRLVVSAKVHGYGARERLFPRHRDQCKSITFKFSNCGEGEQWINGIEVYSRESRCMDVMNYLKSRIGFLDDEGYESRNRL